VPSLGIDWPGNGPIGAIRSNSRSSPGVTKNAPLLELIRDLFLPPGRLTDDERKYTHLYGLGVPWVLLPAAALVFGRLGLEALRRWRGSDALARRRYVEVLYLLLTATVTLVTSTNRSTPRYHISTIALWVPVVAWAIGRRRALQESLAFAATIGSLAVIAWEFPGWRAFPSPAEMVALWRLDPTLRQVTPELGSPVLRETGLAREHDLVAGTTVVSDDFVFPSILWNDDFSNHVVYVRPGADVIGTAEKLDATWIYANDAATVQRVRARPDWQELGPLYAERWGKAFRRLR
jgi:hypothetical protein